MTEKKNLYLCTEIGGTYLRIGVIREDLSVLEFERIPSTGLSEAADKGGCLKGILDPLIGKYGKERFLCISLSLASLMDRERTICHNSPNLNGFEELPLKQILEDIWQIPVLMERDVNTALLFDIWKSGISPEGIIIGIYIGTGLGNAMSINGKLYTGHTGSSCELGHIPMEGIEEMCGCGKKGCIELRACGRVLRELAEKKYHCPVEDIFILHGQEQPVRDVVRFAALAAAAEVSILDPSWMILGGGVVQMKDFPLQYFEEILRDNLRTPEPRESLRILLSSPDHRSGVIGAAIHASSRYGGSE